MERPEAAATAIDETPTDTEETGTPVEEAAVDEGPLSPADMRAKAAALHGDVLRRDFAFPVSDPRHWCLPSERTDNGDSGSEGDFVDQSMDAFDDSTSSLGSNFSTGWARKKETIEVNCNQLLADLDLAKMLEGKLLLHQFTFAKARAMYEFQGVTEWEMTIREGEGILLLDRQATAMPMLSEEDAEMSKNLLSPLLASLPEPPTSAPSDRTASIDSPNPLPPVAIYLRPRSFALDLDRFLDYRRLYPDGWSLGLKVKIKVKGRLNRRVNAQGKTKVALDKDGKLRVRVKLVDKGLVPTNYVDAETGTEAAAGLGVEAAAAEGAEGAEGAPADESVTSSTTLDDLADTFSPLTVDDQTEVPSADNSDEDPLVSPDETKAAA